MRHLHQRSDPSVLKASGGGRVRACVRVCLYVCTGERSGMILKAVVGRKLKPVPALIG